MQHLAVETLQQIFAFACTDGGYTGCSLSFVSKYIRDASRPVRFHSVSLASGSASQVVQFSSCFFAQHVLSPDITPKIRHLCIISAKREQEVYSRPKAEEDKEQHRFSAHVSSLLQAVAPDLYTLCLVHGHRIWPKELRLPNLGGVSFPLLQELTIVGSGMNFAPAEGLLDGGGGPYEVQAQLPRLTRLHLTFTFTGLRTGVDFTRWATRAPRITHFRLSNLDYYSGGILAHLKQMSDSVGPGSASEGRGQQGACPFLDLERLAVQPHAPPKPRGRCQGNPWSAYELYVDALRTLCRGAAPRFRMLAPTNDARKSGDFEEVARLEWIERMNGGPGCWGSDIA